jgi:hypothetical protein
MSGTLPKLFTRKFVVFTDLLLDFLCFLGSGETFLVSFLAALSAENVFVNIA